jgi:hypothetical protein
VKYWKIIADNLDKPGWRWGSISTTDDKRRQFGVVAAERQRQYTSCLVTAEIAILNKSAGALAADSAVKITVGSGQKNL